MKSGLTNDVLHNPFKNRFHDPVTRRWDEMQAYGRDLIDQLEQKHEEGTFNGVFALVMVVLATVFVLFRG